MGAHGGWDGFPGGTLPRGEPCRRRRQGGKERREKGEKCICFICLFFPLFFVYLYKHKKGWFFCAYLYVYTKKKKMYM